MVITIVLIQNENIYSSFLFSCHCEECQLQGKRDFWSGVNTERVTPAWYIQRSHGMDVIKASEANHFDLLKRSPMCQLTRCVLAKNVHITNQWLELNSLHQTVQILNEINWSNCHRKNEGTSTWMRINAWKIPLIQILFALVAGGTSTANEDG